MVSQVHNSSTAVPRPTTLGEKLVREARQALENPAQSLGGRTIEDRVDLSTVDIGGGHKAVNLARGGQLADEVRNAKPEDLVEKLDRGLAEGFHIGKLFRSVFKSLAGLFRAYRS
ncbi:MAG: hypothetical protein COW30_18235 [Rhodospirillales bacterium CG15_BIG_FIL_POST_REV_8_21_14_020_66_15]|nr:MAG: hypothetical protein COW30_18235 [Rhodospirillales bacterium CG15_BIG_FIL_POST_REV_8_21_14_020_66_15]